MNGLVIIFALGFNIHTVHVIIMYQQYVKCYRNKYLYIFQSLANTDQNSLCLPSWHSKKIGEYTQALTFLIKHWEFWLKFDTWSTFACSLYTQIVILCKFGNCINHGVEMLKNCSFTLQKDSDEPLCMHCKKQIWYFLESWKLWSTMQVFLENTIYSWRQQWAVILSSYHKINILRVLPFYWILNSVEHEFGWMLFFLLWLSVLFLTKYRLMP